MKTKLQNKLTNLRFSLYIWIVVDFGWSRFIMLLMASSGWHSLFIEQHAGAVGNKLTPTQSAIEIKEKINVILF